MDNRLGSVLFDQVNVSVAFFDGEGIMVESNKAWEMFFLTDSATEIILTYDDFISRINISSLLKDELIHVTRARFRDKNIFVRQKRITESDCGGIMVEVENISALEQKILHSDRFFSEIIWKIRSRISSIQNVTTLFVEYKNESLDTESLDLLKKTRLEIWETMRLAENLRYFSILEHNTLTTSLDIDFYQLNELIDEVLQESDIIKSTVKNPVHVTTEISPGIFVHTDRKIFKYVMSALISNAIKYNSDEILVAVNAFVLDDRLSISVTDNGFGIAESDQYKVFSYPFFSDLFSRNFSFNAGVELHLVHRLLKFIDGEIFFESGMGVGSTFTVALKGFEHDSE